MAYNEDQKVALAKKRGQAAAQIQDPAQRAKFIAQQGQQEAKGDTDYQSLERDADDTLATQGENYNTNANKKKNIAFFGGK